MKYLIHARGGDPLLFANILSEELFRFDIRAEINGRESIEVLSVGSFSSSAFDVNADVIIVIGNDFNKKLISQSKSVGISSLFIAIEESLYIIFSVCLSFMLQKT